MKSLIFVYGLSFGGAAAALGNPFIGLLAYIALAILRPYSLWQGTVPTTNYSQIVAIGLLIGWLVRGFGQWRFGRAWAVVLALVAFGTWMVVTTRSAVDPEAAWYIVDIMAKIIIPFLVGMSTIDSVRKLKQLAWVIVLSQGYVAFEFNMTYLGGYNRLWLEGFGSLDNNGNAVALVACSGVAMFLALYTANWIGKAAAAASLLLMVHAILFSFSRGGMMALAVTSLMTFVLIPKRPAHYAGFLLGILLVARLAGPQVVERFQQAFVTEKGQDSSADARLNQWTACLQSIASNPLGVGPDQWKHYSLQFGLPEGQAAHSTWLQVAVEMGIPGLIALLAFYGLCIIRLMRLLRSGAEGIDPWAPHLARMVVASLTGYMIAAQFVSVHLLEVAYYVALIGVGLLKLSSMPRAEPLGEGVPSRFASLRAC